MILFFAIFWPFVSLVLAVRDFNFRDFSVAIISVAVMFGLCMQVMPTLTFQDDITRNLANAASYKNISWSSIFSERDYFIGITGKLLGQISDDLRFLAVCYVLIKSVLFLCCMRIVVANTSEQDKRIALLPLLAMIFVVSFYDINSLRFTFASVYFLLCSLQILINRNKWFYALILLSPLIHYGFWIMAPVPFLYFCFKNKTLIVWLVFVLSIVYSTASTSIWISETVEEIGTDVLSQNVSGYASETNLELMAEKYSEGARLGNTNRAISRLMVDIRNYGVMICVVLLSFLCYRKRKDCRMANQVMNFLLIVYSCANIANSNSQGIRFYLVAAMVVVFMLVYMIYQKDNFSSFYTNNKFFIITAFCIVVLAGALYLFIGRYSMNVLGVMFGNYLIHL